MVDPRDDLDEIKRCVAPRLERRYPLIAPDEIARLIDEEAAALDLDDPRLRTTAWPAGPAEPLDAQDDDPGVRVTRPTPNTAG